MLMKRCWCHCNATNARPPEEALLLFKYFTHFCHLLPIFPPSCSPHFRYPLGKLPAGGDEGWSFFCVFFFHFFFQTPSHLSLLNGKNIARVITATRPTGRTPWVIGPILGKFLRLDWLYKRTDDFFKLLNVLLKGGFVFFQAFFFPFLMWIINISIPIREK